jgi:uncharacterized protein
MNPADPPAQVGFTLVPFGLLLGVVLCWVKFVERRSLASIGLTGGAQIRTFLQGHAVGALSLLGIAAICCAGRGSAADRGA